MHPLCIDCNGGQAAICKVSDHKHTFTRSGVSVVELQKGGGRTLHWPNAWLSLAKQAGAGWGGAGEERGVAFGDGGCGDDFEGR